MRQTDRQTTRLKQGTQRGSQPTGSYYALCPEPPVSRSTSALWFLTAKHGCTTKGRTPANKATQSQLLAEYQGGRDIKIAVHACVSTAPRPRRTTHVFWCPVTRRTAA